MATTEFQRRRFRMAIGVLDADQYSDTNIEDCFTVANATYPDGSTDLIFAQAVITGIEDLMALAAQRVDYRQNESSFSDSDLAKNYEMLLKHWTKKRDEALVAINQTVSSVGFARIKGRTVCKDEPRA